MVRKLLSLVIPIVIVGLALSPVIASAASFYEGKVIRIIVGVSAGGGYDAYARTLSRHMGKYIPGNPAIIVENMPGAGSLVSANYLYKAVKPDGLNIGHFAGSLFINQLMGQPGIEFDAMKFEFIGAAVTEEIAFAFTKASGITSIEKWMASKTPVKVGGQGVGTPNDNSVRVVRAALGLPIQLVSGYKGSADIRLAVESGELQGGRGDGTP